MPELGVFNIVTSDLEKGMNNEMTQFAVATILFRLAKTGEEFEEM